VIRLLILVRGEPCPYVAVMVGATLAVALFG